MYLLTVTKHPVNRLEEGGAYSESQFDGFEEGGAYSEPQFDGLAGGAIPSLSLMDLRKEGLILSPSLMVQYKLSGWEQEGAGHTPNQEEQK